MMKTKSRVSDKFIIIAFSLIAIIFAASTSCKKDDVSKIVYPEGNGNAHFKSLGDTILPAFLIGDSLAYIYFISNYEYPQSAKDQGIEGKIIVQFTVNTDSTLSNFTIVKSLSEDCDKEAISIIQGLEKMSPSSIKDSLISRDICIPILLELD